MLPGIFIKLKLCNGGQDMFKRKWYEWLLTIVYIAMVGLCVFLNFSQGHKESLATIIVNIVMFIIVAIIFLSADFGSFAPMNAIISDLKQANEKIRKDAMNTHSYLWEPYKSNSVELFKTKKMQEIFHDFLFELNRDEDPEFIYYKPNLDEYINEDMIDSVMHRNELNQVAGMLTGLGILGTFIGLSLGLQNFNTGTTAQMTESIEPLMNGIKVAFHTSIYGMVFSLTFNAIYKRKLYEAQEAVDRFINSFKKYVLPDTANDGMNEIVKLLEDQLEATNTMAENIAGEITEAITPHLEEMHDTIVDFENVATQSQAEAISKVVDVFINEMNRALGATFVRMDQTVSEMCSAQQSTMSMMQRVLDSTGRSTGTLEDVNRETEKLVVTLNKYSAGIQAVLDELQKTVDVMRDEEKDSKELLVQEQEVLEKQKSAIEGLKESITEMTDISKQSAEDVSNVLADINDELYHISRVLDGKKDSGRPTRR